LTGVVIDAPMALAWCFPDESSANAADQKLIFRPN
jgi:hypothetical protein